MKRLNRLITQLRETFIYYFAVKYYDRQVYLPKIIQLCKEIIRENKDEIKRIEGEK